MTDSSVAPEPAPAAAPEPNLTAVIRSRRYIVLLVLGAVIGVPVATVAYFFLDAVVEAPDGDLHRPPDAASGSMASLSGGRCPG